MINMNKCPNCNQSVEEDMEFCGRCGTKLGWRITKCPKCRSLVPADNFCEVCGEPLPTTSKLVDTDTNWIRNKEEISVKKNVDSGMNIIQKSIIVEHGTVCLLIQKGKLLTVLTPGDYKIGGLKSTIAKFSTDNDIVLVFIDNSPFFVDMDFKEEFITDDNIPVSLKIRISMQINRPEIFFTGFIKGKEITVKSDIVSHFKEEIKSVLKLNIKKGTAEDIYKNKSFYENIKNYLLTGLSTSMNQFGIMLLNVDYISFEDSKWITLLNKKGELTQKNIREKEKLLAELELKRIEKDYEIENKVIEIEKEEELEEKVNKRVAELARQKMSRKNSEEFIKLKSNSERGEFLIKQFKEKKLNEFDLKKFARELNYKSEDADRAREFFLKKSDMLNEQELQRLKNAFALDMQKDLYRKHISDTKVEEEINYIKKVEELRRKLKETESQLERSKIEAQIDKIELESAFRLREQQRELKKKEKLDELEIESKRKQFDQDLFLQKVDKLSKISAEALISVSGSDHAKLLADIEKLKLKKSFTPEQLLAVSASSTPEIAKAFAEKFKLSSEEKIDNLYKSIIDEKDKSRDDIKQYFESVLNLLKGK